MKCVLLLWTCSPSLYEQNLEIHSIVSFDSLLAVRVTSTKREAAISGNTDDQHHTVKTQELQH